jgi:MraZ protein
MLSHIHPWANTIVLGGTDGVAGPPLAGRPWIERWGKQVELFLSTYVNKVDRKGRVSVPATFRSTLVSNRQPNLVVAFPSLRVPAVECTGSDRMEEMQERIDTLEQFSDEYENLTQIFADSHPMMMDPEGRVVLPERLKEYAGIGCDVAFVGLGAMFQLWDPARYEEHRAAVRERSRRQGTTLPARGGAVRRANGGDA